METMKPYACPRHADFLNAPLKGCRYCAAPALGKTMKHEPSHFSAARGQRLADYAKPSTTK